LVCPKSLPDKKLLPLELFGLAARFADWRFHLRLVGVRSFIPNTPKEDVGIFAPDGQIFVQGGGGLYGGCLLRSVFGSVFFVLVINVRLPSTLFNVYLEDRFLLVT